MSLLLIHTGGTIGMTATADGFAPKAGVVETFVKELVGDGQVSTPVDIQLLDPLIDSAEAQPSDWTRVAETIVSMHSDYQGVVVTHGTDTLAYTAAALSFALEGLSIPVIVTGSMLPLTVPNNDGTQNLHDALNAAASAPAGVWVQFAGQLLHGARTRKSHSRDFDAFRADPWDTPPVQVSETLKAHAYRDHKIAVLALAPGIPFELFQTAAEVCDGLVLRVYGSGTAPNSDTLAAALHTARSRGIPVLGVSQCPEGGMALGTYAAGSILINNGVIDGRDMTVEAAYAKMHHALSAKGDPMDRLNQNLCGEITKG